MLLCTIATLGAAAFAPTGQFGRSALLSRCHAAAMNEKPLISEDGLILDDFKEEAEPAVSLRPRPPPAVPRVPPPAPPLAPEADASALAEKMVAAELSTMSEAEALAYLSGPAPRELGVAESVVAEALALIKQAASKTEQAEAAAERVAKQAAQEAEAAAARAAKKAAQEAEAAAAKEAKAARVLGLSVDEYRQPTVRAAAEEVKAAADAEKQKEAVAEALASAVVVTDALAGLAGAFAEGAIAAVSGLTPPPAPSPA
eukprot:4720457-Prymnesium_polylepis.1